MNKNNIIHKSHLIIENKERFPISVVQSAVNYLIANEDGFDISSI